MESFKITRIKGNNKEIAEDVVAEEAPLTIVIGKKELVTLLCTPRDLEDLARGFLFTSGLVKKADQIKKMLINKESWIANIKLNRKANKGMTFKRLYTSGCGGGTIFYNAHDIMYRSKIKSMFKVESAQIAALMSEFRKKSEMYIKTGGVHSAALADGKEMLVFREDIGRHNAIDKVIGSVLPKGNSLTNNVLLTSGRVSSEVLFKARKACIPVIVSKSAPTNQAVKLARGMGITLVGFARGSRMNIYSGEERVKMC